MLGWLLCVVMGVWSCAMEGWGGVGRGGVGTDGTVERVLILDVYQEVSQTSNSLVTLILLVTTFF